MNKKHIILSSIVMSLFVLIAFLSVALSWFFLSSSTHEKSVETNGNAIEASLRSKNDYYEEMLRFVDLSNFEITYFPEGSLKSSSDSMYKHYLQVMPNAKYPYAACAFFNFISTDANAYKVWGDDVGDYPSLPSINVDRTQFGNGTLDGTTFTQKAGEATVFPCLNDPSSNWWLNKGGAIVETPSYIGANYTTVIDFIDACIAAK